MNSDEYQASATCYDRLLAPMLRQLRADIRTFIQYRGYRNIIDICCGIGDQLQILDQANMNLVGIDNSKSMLEKARNRCSDNVTLHLLDVEQMQAPDEPFDCAVLSFSLHEKHPTGRDHIFHNARKMVRQGGSLIIADYSGNVDSMKGSVIRGSLLPLIERCAGRKHYQNYQDWNQNRGLEGFLERQNLTVDVISKPYGGTVLCCAVQIDDDKQTFNKHIALLNQSLESQPPAASQNHEHEN